MSVRSLSFRISGPGVVGATCLAFSLFFLPSNAVAQNEPDQRNRREWLQRVRERWQAEIAERAAAGNPMPPERLQRMQERLAMMAARIDSTEAAEHPSPQQRARVRGSGLRSFSAAMERRRIADSVAAREPKEPE